MFPEVFDLEYTKMKFWKAEEFVFSKSMNVTPKKMPVFAMCYQQDYPLKMAKWMQFPLLSPIKVVTEVDPNKFVIVNFRVAIKKKQNKQKAQQTTNQTNTPHSLYKLWAKFPWNCPTFDPSDTNYCELGMINYSPLLPEGLLLQWLISQILRYPFHFWVRSKAIKEWN